MTWRTFCGLGLILLAVAGFSVAVYRVVNTDSTQSKPADPIPFDPQDAVSNEPWPVLSDGRLLMDIYGEKIAIPNCLQCRYDSFRVMSDNPLRLVADMLVQAAIQEPAKLRRSLAKGAFFIYDTGNGTATPGRYLDHFDRRTIPQGNDFSLYVHRSPLPAGGCPLVHARLELKACEMIRELETNQTGPDTGVFARLKVHSYEPPNGLQNYVYVALHAKYTDALGNPLVFTCGENLQLRLRGCGIGAPFSGAGFFLKPNISFSFGFRVPPGEPDMVQMLDTFGTMRAAMEYLIVTDKSPEIHHEH